MSFLTHLESVVNQVDGALACSVMGFDGIAVETHQQESLDDVELQNSWIEYANIVTQLPPIFERFYGNPEHCTCKQCGFQVTREKRKA